MQGVYLFHFDKRLHHAGHYLGFTENLEERIRQHQSGKGANLTRVATQQGIKLILARTWKGDRALERQLKKRKNSPRLCPYCNQKVR